MNFLAWILACQTTVVETASIDSIDTNGYIADTPPQPSSWFEGVSGSRLKRIIFNGEDGSKSQTGWWDTVLETECTMMHHSSGHISCLPIGQATPSAYYSDEYCQEQLALASGCIEPKFATEYVCLFDDNAADILPLGSEHIGDIYYINGGLCTQASNPGLSLWQMGEPMPASQFVVGNETVD